MRCKREQKIAYNFLFTDCHINNMSLDRILVKIDIRYKAELEAKYKKFNTDLLKQYISVNFETYKSKPFIASTYDEIAQKITLEVK